MPNFDFLKETSGSFAHPGIKPGIEPDSVNEHSKNEKSIDPRTPRNSINRLVANVKSSGLFSRPYLYYIVITLPDALRGSFQNDTIDSIGLNCDAISIPGMTIATKPNKTYGLRREFSYDKLLEPITASFYLSEEMHEFNLIEKWLNLQYDANGHVGYYKDYTSGGISIFQCTNKKVSTDSGSDLPQDLPVIMEAKLIEPYPKSISGIDLSHGSAGTISKVTTTIMYKDVIYDYKIGLKDHESSTSVALGKMATDAMVNASTLIGNPFNSLKLPKLGTLIKNNNSFLPIKNPINIENFM
jgi:hypothetical protein